MVGFPTLPQSAQWRCLKLKSLSGIVVVNAVYNLFRQKKKKMGLQLGRRRGIVTWHIWVSFNKHRDGGGGAQGLGGGEGRTNTIWERQNETAPAKQNKARRRETWEWLIKWWHKNLLFHVTGGLQCDEEERQTALSEFFINKSGEIITNSFFHRKKYFKWRFCPQRGFFHV